MLEYFCTFEKNCEMASFYPWSGKRKTFSTDFKLGHCGKTILVYLEVRQHIQSAVTTTPLLGHPSSTKKFANPGPAPS